MDVDYPVPVFLHKMVRENAHIAGSDDQVCIMALKQAYHRILMLPPAGTGFRIDKIRIHSKRARYIESLRVFFIAYQNTKPGRHRACDDTFRNGLEIRPAARRKK